MKIFTNYGISNSNNKHWTFKANHKAKVVYVKEKLRKTGAQAALESIFGERIKEAKTLIRSLIEGTGIQRTDGLKANAFDRQTTHIKDMSDNLLLSVYKTTHFSEAPTVQKSPQALKLSSFELKDALGNGIQKIDVYTNSRGKYKIELYDWNGKFTDEYLGLKKYGSHNVSSVHGNPVSPIKPIVNEAITMNGYEHVKYYPESMKTSYIERDTYDAFGNKIETRIPMYENGKLTGIRILSTKRKLIRTLQTDTTREPSSGEWRYILSGGK